MKIPHIKFSSPSHRSLRIPALIQVCAVCAEGHTPGLGFTCVKCSGVRRNMTIGLGAVLLGAAVVMVAVSLNFLGSSASGTPKRLHASCERFRRVISRLRSTKATQALKIVIVSWQIVTQASCSYSTIPTSRQLLARVPIGLAKRRSTNVGAGAYLLQ